MAAIIRLKRKACDERAEGLVIAFKKPKCDLTDINEVLFKFAATLNSEKDSVRDHIQAALSKEKTSKFAKWRDPKNIAVRESTVKKLCEKLKAEHKTANDKKKLDYLNNRRLILAEEFQDPEESIKKDAEVRQMFHLYDIIEENEEVKKQNDEGESMITCNDELLIREKIEDYVFDVYIAEGHIDRTFVDGTVSVRPCTLTADDIYSGDSGDSEECCDDEDDSNDENNWRNDYPEESDSNSEKDKDSGDSGSDYDAVGYDDKVVKAFHRFDINKDSGDSGSDSDAVSYDDKVVEGFHHFDIDEDDDEAENFDYSRVLKELKEDYDEKD